MEFRRSGQRDDRRRRVRLDERVGSVGTRKSTTLSVRSEETDSAEPPLSGKTYHDDACSDRQWRITDLIPTRFGTFFVLMLVGVAAIVGIEALYGQYDAWCQTLGPASVAAFDPTGPGSVAGWFSSFLLAVCSATALMIYAIRRHKEDDYRGRYRVWVWAAVVWLLGSMAAVAPLHPLVAAVIAQLSGSQLTGNPVVFSSSFYAMILVTVAVPVAVDMCQSRLALTVMCLAGAAYVTGVAIDLGFVAALAGPLEVMCLSTARLTSHLLLLLSLQLFARHVYLDALGMIAAKPRRTRQRQATPQRTKPVWASRKTKKPALRVVSNDLGDTVTEAPEPEVPRRKTKSAPAAKEEPATARKRSKRATRATTKSKATRTRSKPTQEEPDTPQIVKVPSISRKTVSAVTDEVSEEVARLEAIEPHLLTKAQRRRLRKLQRRSGRKAA
jgi:hypothetical protein